MDDSHFIEVENCFFGIHRLAIETFESELNQPFLNGKYLAVFNGEIYNYKEIALEFGISAKSEIEVIVKCYEKFGDNFVELLEGMFAIAIYDGSTLRLFRDRAGKKPLYFTFDGESFSFASEIKALKNNSEINSDMLLEYLSFQTTISPKTFFNKIYSLSASSTLVFDGQNVQIYSYFNPLNNNVIYKDKKSAILAVEKVLKESVKKRLPNKNIPYGALLSGGLDSSLVAAIASQYEKIDTFCMGYEDKFISYDERKYAQMTAEHIGSNHHEAILTKDKFFDTLEMFDLLFDEPLGDPAAVPLYVLLNEVKKSGKRVVLGGDGSDELFFGYSRYREFYDIENISKLKNKNWLKNYFRSNYSINKEWEWYKRALEESIVFRSSSELFTDLQQNRLLKKNVKDDHSLEAILPHWEEYQRSGRNDILDWYSFCDMKIRLGELYLKKLDMVSMACQVEVRSPFLDSSMINTAFGIEGRLRLGDTNKDIIKDIATKYLPDTVINRKKRGFSYPYMEWLLEENALELIKKVQSKHKIFHEDHLNAILNKVDSGGFKNQIFAIYMYCRWLERKYAL
jgi:asparagine synthase (glutamine-hydrolysing)